MSSLQTMYPAVANSPQVTIVETITATATTIKVDAPLPPPPNLLVIGNDADCETILYKVFDSATNTITDCERGFQGTAKGWLAGTKASRNFTAYDYDAFMQNILQIGQDVEGIDKTAIGLGNVENYGVATQAEAEAGTAADKYMTPIRVAQAINKMAKGSRSTQLIIAASNASEKSKAGADYVCSGVDDNVQINDMITAGLSASGGEVLLTEGTFQLNGAITVPANTTLRGAGFATIIRLKDGAIDSRRDLILSKTGAAGGIVLRDFTLDGNKGSGIRVDGITLRNVRNCEITGVRFLNIGYTAINVVASAESLINNNFFVTSFKGVEVASDSRNMQVYNNTFNDMDTNAVLIIGEGNIVRGNTVIYANDGIEFKGPNNLMEGNIALSCRRNGLVVSGGGYNAILNNVIRGSAYEAISVWGSSTIGTFVGNNDLHGNGTAGFYDGAEGTIAQGNRL